MSKTNKPGSGEKISRRGFLKAAEKWSAVVSTVAVGAGAASLGGCFFDYEDFGYGDYSDYWAYSAYSDYSAYGVYGEYGAYSAYSEFPDYGDYCDIWYCDSSCQDYELSSPVCYCDYADYCDSGCYGC